MRIHRQKLALLQALVAVAACSAHCVSQNNNGVSPAPRQQGPLMRQTNPNGGMLQTRPPAVLSPGLAGNDVERMTQAQFRALPDSATLRYKGQSLTKASFKQEKLREFQAGTTQAPIGLSFQMLQARFQQQQAANLAARNARVQAVMDALDNRTGQLQSSAAYSALAQEAVDLQHRYSTSSSAQQEQLKRRALAIHNQLLDMERGAK